MTLDKRTKELIAVGASVAAHCQPCLAYHRDKSLANGASEEEVAQAIEVGKLVGRGAAANIENFAATISPQTPANKDAAGSGGCCAASILPRPALRR